MVEKRMIKEVYQATVESKTIREREQRKGKDEMKVKWAGGNIIS